MSPISNKDKCRRYREKKKKLLHEELYGKVTCINIPENTVVSSVPKEEVKSITPESKSLTFDTVELNIEHWYSLLDELDKEEVCQYRCSKCHSFNHILNTFCRVCGLRFNLDTEFTQNEYVTLRPYLRRWLDWHNKIMTELLERNRRTLEEIKNGRT